MSCCEGRGCSQCDNSEKREINRIANLLFKEWCRVDPTSGVAMHPVSYMANFADMARVVIVDRDKVHGECAACDGFGYTGSHLIVCEACDGGGLCK